MATFNTYAGQIATRHDELARKGAIEGGSARPPENAASLDGNETDLVLTARKFASDEQHVFSGSLTPLKRHLSEADQKALQFPQEAESLINDDSVASGVAAHLAGERSQMGRITRAKLEREADLQRFKALNNITHQAIYPESHVWHVMIILACMLGETIANAFFFRNESGLLGGFVIALMVSIINMGLAGALGFFFRYKNHIRLGYKVAGWLSLPLAFAVTAYCNAVFAAFRSTYSRLEDTGDPNMVAEAFGQALAEASKIFVFQFSFGDFMSFILFWIGVILAGLAFWKGMTYDDPYPGHGAKDRKYRESEQELEAAEKVVREKVRELVLQQQGAVAAVKLIPSTQSTLLGTQVTMVESACKHLMAQSQRIEGDFQLVLKAYRDSNRAVRAVPAPAYFENMPTVVDAVDATEGQKLLLEFKALQSRFGQLRSQYEDAISAKLQRLKHESAAIQTDTLRQFLKDVELDARSTIAQQAAGVTKVSVQAA